MAAGIDLATAYVNVVPKFDKSFDAASVAKEGGEAAGSSFEGGMLSKLSGTAVKLAAAVGVAAVAKGLYDIGAAALDAYASFEQLSGGVEKLFGEESAARVQQYASAAYKTAGLSANAYMETVTGFSASLISSLEGDTARAAQVADQAVQDMSDNANTFGTDIQSIQNAYQGFAKNNYTMLDNLKLGYAGSQEGMQQLLDKAEELSGQHFELGNFADMAEAIHIVQEDLGIAGTTAAEAMGTIEGSVNMASGAWENWMAGLANTEADMGQLTDQLLEAVGAVISNVAPRVAVIATTMIEAIPGAVARLVESVPGIVDAVVSKFGELFGTSFSSLSLGDGAAQAFSSITGAVRGVYDATLPAREAFSDMMATILQTVSQAIGPLSDALGTIADAVLPALDVALDLVVPHFQRMFELASTIVSSAVPVITSAINMVAALVAAVMPRILSVVEPVMTAIGVVVDTVWPHVREIISAAMAYIQAVIDTVTAAISGDWDSFFEGIVSVAQAAWDLVGSIVSGAIALVQGVIEGALTLITGLWESAWTSITNGVTSAMDFVKSAVSGGIDGIVNWFGGMPGRIVSALGNLGSLLWNAGTSIMQGFLDGLQSMWGSVTDFVGGIADWIAANKGPLPYDAKLLIPAGKAIMGGFESSLRDGYKDVQDFVSGIGADVQASVGIAPVAAAGGTTYNISIDGSAIDASPDVRDALAALVGGVRRTARGM